MRRLNDHLIFARRIFIQKQQRLPLLRLLLMMGLLLAIGGPPVLGPATASAAASDLFFSEYIEGSAENKALEIYNGTGTPVNLASYRIDLYNNGNNAPNATYTLSGMLGTGMTLVIVHQNASAALKNAPSAYVESTKVTSFDGDDALVLVGPNGPVDRIGRVGEDLGDEWAGNGVSTRSSTLRRKPNVCAGDNKIDSPFDPSLQWNAAPEDTFNGLGTHEANCDAPAPGQPPLINEFVFGHTKKDDHEFIEVLGAKSTDYSAYRLVLIDGNADQNPGEIYRVFKIGQTSPNGYWITGLLEENFNDWTSTLLLVRDFTGAVGTDLDFDNDGILDSAPWAEITDDVAVTANEAGDRTYAAVVLGPGFSGNADRPLGASRLPNGTDTDSANDWTRNHFNGEGLGCAECGGFAGPNEAVNTPFEPNKAGKQPPPTPTPTMTATATGTPTNTPDPSIPDNCRDILLDSGFEAMDIWRFAKDPIPGRFSADQRTEGLRSVLLGNPVDSGVMDKASYSSVRQAVKIPSNATVAYLTWDHLSLSQEADLAKVGPNSDRQEMILLSPNGMTVSVEYRKLENNEGWENERQDLTAFIGKNLVIYFNVFNDGNDKRTWMYLDFARLVVCYPQGVDPDAVFEVPTPMPLPTTVADDLVVEQPAASEPTPTPTALPTATDTPPAQTESDAPAPDQMLQVVPGVEEGTPDQSGVRDGCRELVVNGKFETTSIGWALTPGVTMPAYSADVAFGGSMQSMRIGSLGGANLPSLSMATQTIELPTNYDSILLSFYYYPISDENPGPGNRQYVDIENATTQQFIVRVLEEARNDREWLLIQYDLTALAGQTIRIVLAANSDGVAGNTAMYVDDLSVLACEQVADVSDTPLPVITLRPTPVPTATRVPDQASGSDGAADSESGFQPRLWFGGLGTLAVLIAIIVVIALLVWGILSALRPNERY